MRETYSLEEVIEICHTKRYDLAMGKNRQKNMQFLIDNDLFPRDLFLFIKENISKADYFAGPLDDPHSNRRGQIWIFLMKAFRKHCYVKLQILNHGQLVHIISFHEQEFDKRRWS